MICPVDSSVTVRQHLDGTISLTHGPHRWDMTQLPGWRSRPQKRRRDGLWKKTAAAPPWKTLRVSHFPTASAAHGGLIETGHFICFQKRRF